MKFIAYTVKGLEQIAENEIKEMDTDAVIESSSAKKVIFSTKKSPELLAGLKTVDDLQVLVQQLKISRNDNIEDISSLIKGFDFSTARKVIESFRHHVPDKFSLTVGTYKTRYKADDLKARLSKEIANAKDWEYEPRNHENFDIRVFGEKRDLYIGVRLTEKSLYFRNYKVESVEGALRPTIAAAMVRLISGGDDDRKNPRLVDNFCGSGTILAEAFKMGYEVYGGDINPKAIAATKSNLKEAGFGRLEDIKVQDGTKSKWQKESFDLAVSNLPWDEQIEVASITDLYIGMLREYKRILKPGARLCFLVHKHDLLIKHIRNIFGNDINIETGKIGYLGQNPSIVVVEC